MVCSRCEMMVRSVLANLELDIDEVTLGEVVFNQEISDEQKQQLADAFAPLGFELIDDKRSIVIEKIKNVIIELVHHRDGQLAVNLSDLLVDELHHDYSYLSNLFSEVEGTTIEKYFIAQKIERVKELLVYDELTLSEIALLLNYSSVAHLSNQFKKVTGLTPSHFRQIKEKKRKPIDEV